MNLELQHSEASEQALRQVPDSVLLPYQQRWVADDAAVKVVEKSRRIGLSWGEASDAALYAAKVSGANVYYMAYNQDMTQGFINDCAFWARFYNLAASEVEEVVLRDEDRDVKIFQISFASGHVIQALSSHPRNLRSKGKPGERVILDEFAFHDHQDELLKAAMAFTMWGGQVRIVSTHNGVENGFNRLIEEVRAGKRPYSLHRITLDDALGEGLYRRICLIRGLPWSPEAEAAWRDKLVAEYGDGADEELFCIPRRSGGRYIPRAIVEQCMREEIPVVRLNLPDEFATLPEEIREAQVTDWCNDHLRPLLEEADEFLKSGYGMDFARSGDLSVLMPFQEEPNLIRRVLFALELRNVPFEQQRQILFYVVDRLPKFVSGANDATGNGAYLAEVAAQRYGAGRIHQIKLNGPWYQEYFPKYKAGLEDRMLALPLDGDVLDDHGDVIVQNGIPIVPANKTRKGNDGGQRHGDAAIAALLMWFASINHGAPIEYQSLPRPRAERQVYDYEDVATVTDRGFGSVAGRRDFAGFV